MIAKEMQNIIEPVVQSLGFELWGCDLNQGGSSATLRVFIEGQEGQGVTIDDCAKISREIGAVLDVEDPISKRYQLEVSSPGMDRILFTVAHFARYVGHDVKVKLRAAKNNLRNFTAIIQSVTDDEIVLKVSKETISVRMSDIQKANLIVR